MSEFKGTPGPWVVGCSSPTRAEVNTANSSIADVWNLHRDVNHVANAHLIAAAPELLEALQAFDASADLWLPANVGEDRVHEAEALHQLRHKASAAIAKALNTDTTER
ncbi:hypothetical protein [Alloalcanivorax venustensis]|jgi:hypothetical protein|uniref:hypothetical protein n=1 Tax=Alloalcanivorax venustensis TaxID=172371 RepID=UPI0039E6AF6E